MGRVSDAKERLMEAVSSLIWTGSYGATTIDQICDRAGVKKGSFYYFFDSKADLALASLNAVWEKKQAVMDRVFSPLTPPLERIRNYLQEGYDNQLDMKNKCGCVLGCPLYTLGSEVSTQEQALRARVLEIIESHRRYLESAIRDAAKDGLLQVGDPAVASRSLFAYYEGVLTQARISNDLAPLKEAWGGTLRLLGIKETATAAA